MKTIPAILWELERTHGSGKTELLTLTGKWRFVSGEGIGAPQVEHSGVTVHGVEGELSPTYTVAPRELILGIFYSGAKSQREYYLARRKLHDFTRVNQYVPVKLYVTLPTLEKFFLNVVGNPGAPLALSQERGFTFLENVSFRASNPIWQEVKKRTASILFSEIPRVAVPNKATVSVVGTPDPFSIPLQLGVVAGGTTHSGFIVEVKKSSEADSTYVSHDTGFASQYSVSVPDDNTEYNIRVRAYNSAGNGAYSDIITQVTPEYLPLLEQPAIIPTSHPTSIFLSWAAVETAAYYQVRYKLSTSIEFSGWARVDSTSYTLSGLEAQARYDIEVRAVFIGDGGTHQGGHITAQEITTAQHAPPNRPANVEGFRDDIGEPSGVQIQFPSDLGGPATYVEISGRSRVPYVQTWTLAVSNVVARGHLNVPTSLTRGYGDDTIARICGPGGCSAWVS